MTAGRRPVRVRAKHVEWVRERLSERDRAVLAAVQRLRLATSTHLERLLFADLPTSHRSRTRRRVLARLVAWRVLMTLERRIGGVRAGSAGFVYALDSAGLWLADYDDRLRGEETALRRPAEPSQRLLAHTLAVSELYVALREHEQSGVLRLEAFATEPDCWWPNGAGGWLKPDAHLVVSSGDVADHWWLELDQATESLPTIRRKLTAYLDFVRRGQRGPAEVVPRVLVSTPSVARREAVTEVIQHLPEPADQMMRAVTHEKAADYIGEVLRE